MAKDDNSDFPASVGPVRRIKQDRVAPHRPRRRPVPAQSKRDEREVVASLLSDEYETAEIETGEELLYSRPGLQHAVMRRLRRGQYAIESELDLHGFTVPQAREALHRFLLEAMEREGKIRMDDFVIVDQRKDDGFPFVHSTTLYPEWYLTAVSPAAKRFGNKTKTAVINITPDMPVAKKAKIAGFVEPLPLDEMKSALRSLRITPYDK
jgi:hypothetical protein